MEKCDLRKYGNFYLPLCCRRFIFLGKQLSAHHNLPNSCRITCRRRSNIKSGLLLIRLWLKDSPGGGPHRRDGRKIRKLKSYVTNSLKIHKSWEHSLKLCWKGSTQQVISPDCSGTKSVSVQWGETDKVIYIEHVCVFMSYFLEI